MLKIAEEGIFPRGVWIAPIWKEQSPVGGGCSQVHWIPHKPISLNMTSPEGVDPPRCSCLSWAVFLSGGNLWHCLLKHPFILTWRETGTFKGLYFSSFFPQTNLLLWKLLALRSLTHRLRYISFMLMQVARWFGKYRHTTAHSVRHKQAEVHSRMF